ncbi:hypothetical protein BGZ73_005914 [Actinomortierella ambigua]|nr:hypothetical protein BGZ73_005914 [Actinomortierella ambigua]
MTPTLTCDVPQPGRLTPEQAIALGELWSYLLHLWYADTSNHQATPGDNCAMTDTQLQRSQQLSPPTGRKWKGFGVLSRLHKSDLDKFLPTAQSDVSVQLSPLNESYYHFHSHLQQQQQQGTADALTCLDSLENSLQPLKAKVCHLQQKGVIAVSSTAAYLKPWPLAAQGKFKYKFLASVYHDAFWTWVQNEHPDSILIRCLKARGWKAEKAMEHLMSALEWRITYGIHETFLLDEEALDARYPGFVYLLQRGKIALVGYDRQRRPLLFGDPTVQGHPYHIAFRMLAYYGAEHTRMLFRPPNDTFSGLFDLSTLSLSDVKLASPSYISHADYNYGQMMGVAAVYKPPWIFYTAWKLVAPFFDEKVRQNLNMTSTSEEAVGLLGQDVVDFMQAQGGDDSKGPALSQALGDNAPLISQDRSDEPPKSSNKNKAAKKDTSDNKEKHKDCSLQSSSSVVFKTSYVRPVPGENDRFHQDSKTKKQAIVRRKVLELAFEEKTMAWLDQQQREKQMTTDGPLIVERDELGYHLIDAFWVAEPFTRTRSIFHRLGKIPTPKPFFLSDSGLEVDGAEDMASLASPVPQ